jgi:exopolyphosphatase
MQSHCGAEDLTVMTTPESRVTSYPSPDSLAPKKRLRHSVGRGPTYGMPSPLLRFLARARSAALRPTSSPAPTPLILVLGNPSCDLDSFISAAIYSFFHSRCSRNSQYPRLYIPLLNLPSTSSCDLWRLRPEFGTALRLALKIRDHDDKDRAEDADKTLLQNLLTISDIRLTGTSALNQLFTKSTTAATSGKTSVTLVDHNALSIPIPDVSPSEISSHFNITGCIDHHIDEDCVPRNVSPRIITTGIGSCTSLVVQYLRKEGFWRDLIDQGRENDGGWLVTLELATFSLASILIDTANLTAEGKVSETDREVVSFLEEIINTTMNSKLSATQEEQQGHWNRSAFYEEISKSKASSLDLLTLPEIFDRDYKAWSEKTRSSSTELNLGIASVVKRTSWLIEKTKSSSAENFVAAMRNFGKEQTPKLDLFAVMTTGTNRDGDFQRELLVLCTGEGEESRKMVKKIEEMGREELGLSEWNEDEGLVNLLKREHGKIWWQRDVSKSRKQVGPLLREAMRNL